MGWFTGLRLDIGFPGGRRGLRARGFTDLFRLARARLARACLARARLVRVSLARARLARARLVRACLARGVAGFGTWAAGLGLLVRGLACLCPPGRRQARRGLGGWLRRRCCAASRRLHRLVAGLGLGGRVARRTIGGKFEVGRCGPLHGGQPIRARRVRGWRDRWAQDSGGRGFGLGGAAPSETRPPPDPLRHRSIALGRLGR
ncbi:pentapeptide repeat-containing protein [Actinoplanes sp. NPDC049118]|uniref:pentapeptide repeat-containing protein n=1 Tax=Actinoplanes sp. NPDC049118 TaxID=3155769 RepID=UPI0033E78288